jgi:hypothetical protein
MAFDVLDIFIVREHLPLIRWLRRPRRTMKSRSRAGFDIGVLQANHVALGRAEP